MAAVSRNQNETLAGFYEYLHHVISRMGSEQNASESRVLHSIMADLQHKLNISDDSLGDGSYEWDDDWQLFEPGSSYTKYMKLRPVLYTILLSILILVGVLGNILVVMATIRVCKHVTSAFHAFLINLAIASTLFLTICVPLVIYEKILSKPWTLGEDMCQLQRYIQFCTFYALTYAHVLVITCSLAQLVAPRAIAGINNMWVAGAMACSVWVVILLGNIPNYLGHGLYDAIEGAAFCIHNAIQGDWNKLRRFVMVQFTCSYALPFVCMAGMSLWLLHYLLCRHSDRHYNTVHDNTRVQRDTASMNVALTLLFAVCWTPDKILDLLYVHKPFSIGVHLIVMSDLFMFLACCNAALNPWVILVVLRNSLTINLFRRGATTIPNCDVTNGGNNGSAHHRVTSNGQKANTAESTSDLDSDKTKLTDNMELNNQDAFEGGSNAMVQNL